MGAVMSIITWMQESAYATGIRESSLAYPLFQVVHIWGVGLFAGALGFANLRLSGVANNLNLIEFTRHAMRIAWLGLALILFAGLNMAYSFIAVFSISPVFGLKMACFALILINAFYIQKNIQGENAIWISSPPDAKKVKTWASLCIALLFIIIALGKLLAYIGGKD